MTSPQSEQLEASAFAFARSEIIDEVRNRGWAFLDRFESTWSTLRVAEYFGSILDFRPIAGYENFPAVQELRPRNVDDARKTIYSGTFGMERFPFHTDLAHWYWPPRYFLLRCIKGTSDVGTTVLDGNEVVAALGRKEFQRALLQPRRAHMGKRPLLRCSQRVEDSDMLRWDTLFLRSANETAKQLTETFNSSDLHHRAHVLVLREASDTLLVDNWRIFHGRTAVTKSSQYRLVERVYLTGLHP